MPDEAPQSQSQLLQYYYNGITVLDPNLVPSIQGGDQYFTGNAVTQVAANVVQDIQIQYNNIFPASSNGVYLDKHAGQLGMTPRMGALPSQGNAGLVDGTGGSTATAGYTIVAGTLMQSTVTNNQYITTQDVVITMGETITDVILPISSVLLGTGTDSPPGDTLIFANPIVISVSQTITECQVTSAGMVSGSDAESNTQFAVRIFDFSQNPKGGGSSGDYVSWCFLGSSNVTGATTINTNSIGNNNILFPVILEGNSNPNYYVDGTVANGFTPTPAPINRSAPALDINNVQIYINGVRPENDNPSVLTVATYEFTSSIPSAGTSFNVFVSLTPGITLSTQLTLPNLPSPGYITVEALIQREFRRAILSTPLGGTKLTLYPNTANQYITISDIEIVILQGLGNNSTYQGNYASIVEGLSIEYLPGGASNPTPGYVLVPSLQDSNLFKVVGGTWQAYLIYDIDVSILNIIDRSIAD